MLSINNLSKHYPTFTLEGISFDLLPGRIMGLIGKNGAGKTTILKAILNLISIDCGAIKVFGMDFLSNEDFCKQQIGIIFGGIDFYLQKKLSTIANSIKTFYSHWDNSAFNNYLKEFNLNPKKRVKDLSAGMRIKFMLAIALSHNAKLLILDEPTSGLDPVSRDDILRIFRKVVSDGSRSILFSTHIISDLEKCANDITYIKDGKLLMSSNKDEFIDYFQHLNTKDIQQKLSLEEIMIHIERTTYDI